MKKNIKKIALLLTLAMLLATLAACAGSGSGGGSTVETVEQGVLIMATSADFPPYEFWEATK